MIDKYDLFVVGGGPGGYVAAIKAAQLGMKVALAEKNDVGGTCLNRGCIPTKSLLHTAETLRQINNCQSLGINVADVTFDNTAMHRRKNQVVSQLRGGVEALLAANNVKVLKGQAYVQAAGIIQINGEQIASEKILLAAGSEPAIIPIIGIDNELVLTSDDMLQDDCPFYHRLLIIGGGVIGMEFASIYNNLGSEVTVVEAADRILPTVDKSISQNLAMIMKKRGVEIFTSAQAQQIVPDDNGIKCCCIIKGQESQFIAEAILLAVGRKAASTGLFAEDIGIAMDKGQIIVDDNYQTSAPGIYAVGDIVFGSTQLAHAASAQAVNAVCAMAGLSQPVDVSLIPSCIYTAPEIACVGITAAQAKDKGLSVKTGKFSMSSNGKSIIEAADRGFIQFVADAADGTVLGAQLMCSHATDMIGGITAAIVNKLSYHQMLAAVYPHPTFSEGIAEALEDIDGFSLHTMPKKRM